MTTVFELIEANGLTLHGDIEHFAELVRAEEREACAKRIEELEAMLERQTARIVDLQTQIENLEGEE